MVNRTFIRAQVPVGRLDEAWGYFRQLVPDDSLIRETERLGSGVVALGAYLDGDQVEDLEAKVEALDTEGIHFMVDGIPR